MDNSIEQKIYGQQVGKQAMADRVIDELDLEAHVSLKDCAKISLSLKNWQIAP